MPQTRLTDRAAFVEAVKSGKAEGLALRRAFSAETRAVDENARTVDFAISTAAVDRMRDSINVAGWQTENFMRSPVVLWCHQSSEPPIGRALSVTKTSDALMSRAEFMNRDLSPFADTVFRMYQGKYLSAVSVGFAPIKYAFSDEPGREFGLDFIEQELLEYSCCPVPANPEALIAAKSAGIDTAPLREWAEKILDEGGGSVLVPRTLLEETFKLAKTPKTVRRQYLKAETKAADWKVGAARDLPLDQNESWDGPAAEASIFEHAGGENFNPEVARKGFLLYDAAEPKLRGSYKEPFAHVVDGTLKAVKGGIRAAASRLPSTDASPAAKEEAKGVIDHYEKAFGMGEPAKAAGEGTNSDGGALVPGGNCGRSKDEECLFKDPQQCAVHFTPPEPVKSKSGRRISAATKALLEAAVSHHADAAASHEKMLDCIKSAIGSDDGSGNEPDDDPGGTDPEKAKAKRLAAAKKLREDLGITD